MHGCSFVAKLTNCFKLVPRSFERKNRRKAELLKNKIMKLKKLLEARDVIERTTPFSKFCKNWGLFFFQTEFDFWFEVSRSNFCFSAMQLMKVTGSLLELQDISFNDTSVSRLLAKNDHQNFCSESYL